MKQLKLAKKQDQDTILEYLKKDIANCIYLYIDIMNYGVSTENMTVWYQKQDGQIELVVMKYYDSYQIYSHRTDGNLEEVCQLLRDKPATMISARKDMIERLEKEFPEYKATYGIVFRIKPCSEFKNMKSQISRATEEDAYEIAELICSDEAMGGHYTVEGLCEQLTERMRTGAGRSYIARNDQNRLIAHMGTYAETKDIAVLGGSIVLPDYRKTDVFVEIDRCVRYYLTEERKDMYAFTTAKRMIRLQKLLKVICGEYGKLEKVKPDSDSPATWGKKYEEELRKWCAQIEQTDEAGIKVQEYQHMGGKLTARERINLLFDEGSFHELDSYVESTSTDFGMETKRKPGDGVVTGWGRILGQIVYAVSQDASVMGGSLGKVHGDKICRVQDMAYANRAPIVFMMDSGGARVEEGVAALAGYSGIFLRNTKCSGVIPQIALLLGYSVGGSSYLPAMCDFTFMTENTSRMFITGPGVVKEVIGEEISAEELGGARMHSEVSGAADFVFKDDEEVIRETRKFLGYLISDDRGKARKKAPEPDRCGKLQEIVPDDQRKTYDIRKVIKTIVDRDTFYESKKKYAKNLVIGFGRLQGDTIGIVANQPMELGGSLDAKAAEKAARFIRFCDCFRIPILTLVDTPGFFPGKKQEEEGIIRRGAKLLYAYSEATVPKITLVLRKAYGGAYIAMNSKCMGADLVYAWPTAQLAVMGSEGAVNVVFRKEIARAEDPETARKQRKEEYHEKFMNPYFAAKQGYIDEIFMPEDTRRVLVEAFAGLKGKEQDAGPSRKHGNISL